MTTMPSPQTSRREDRWQEEAHFFDDLAQHVDDSELPIDPLALERYSNPVLRNRFNKEYRFRVLSPLAGKTLLDVGCGDGQNAVMFAKMGAHVTGLDISPGAIDVANRRASLNGVSERATFLCSPVETADLGANTFDIVWGDAILHHVLDDLEVVLQHLVRWTKPNGVLLFSEPVNLVRALRALRSLIPVKTEATPDERPLVQAELDLLRRYIPNLQFRYYGLFGRLDQFILTDSNYERSSAARKAIVNVIDSVDYALLSVPFIQRLGGVCVMHGQPNKAV